MCNYAKLCPALFLEFDAANGKQIVCSQFRVKLTCITQMRSEDDPGEESAPGHRSQGSVNGRMVCIVFVVDASHWRWSEEGSHKQSTSRIPTDLHLCLRFDVGENDAMGFCLSVVDFEFV